jgi:ribosomal protein S18 acetylase RimI-like enzyme
MSHFLPVSGRKCDRWAALGRFVAMAHEPEIRDRLLEFEIALDAAVCDEVVEAEWGRAFLTPSQPLVWDDSWIALEQTGMTMRELAALADEVLGGAGFEHRTVCALDETDGRRLFGEVGEVPGWEVELADYMVWSAESGRSPRAEVLETTLAEIAPLRLALMAEWLAEEYGGDVEATAAQLLELEERRMKVVGDRWFVAPADAPTSACCLLSDGRIGQVEEVGTLTAARGRGLAQAVVLTALAESRSAGHELTFLAADADDWPQLMYEKLGFAKVGELHILRKRPPTPGISAAG